ncbi:HPC2 and ubinuclein domain [Mactra antiquata]
MEGPKRLQLTTIAPVGQSEKKTPTVKTFRFELDITEPPDGTCPEFFFTDLQKSSSKENDKTKSDDPFDDDDADQLQAIAKAFEAKYNKPSEGKKKKKWRDNYYLEQLADGYDESDTFIDNSEAYDEVLPETYTTKHGGFYINSGDMEIKEMSDVSEDEFRSPMPVKKNKKKRRISSDEDSNTEQNVVKKKKIKDTLSVDGEMKKKKKKKIIAPGEKGFKKPKIQEKPSKDGKSPGSSGSINSSPHAMNGGSVENGISSSDGDDSKDSKSNISMVIDSVIAMASNDTDGQSEVEEPKKEIDPDSIPKLPSNMPAGTEEKVSQLIAHARESSDGKCKFFTANVNKLLLEVELASKQMTVNNRSAMFGHLAAYLPCSKDTLMKRAKNLRVKELEDKIKEPLDKLKTALNAMMPALIEKYDEECKKAAQEKVEGNKDSPKEDAVVVKEDAGGTESDEEEKTNQSDTNKKKPTGPRKKFIWNNDIRGLLCDVVRVRMHSFSMMKGKGTTAEEFCRSFLETEVRPLWPKGWMQTRALYKECKSAHMPWTNPQKQKKIFTVTKNAISVANSITKTPSTSAPSAPKIPYVSVPKTNSGTPAVKTVNNNSNKGSISLPNTPSAVVKVDKVVTDYGNQPSVNSSVSNNGLNVVKTSMQTVKDVSPNVIKITDVRSISSNPKQTVSSWNHMVSDILRSSLNEQSSGKPALSPTIQRQNSNSTQGSQSSPSGFMAQFMKHIAGGDHIPPKQLSPPGVASDKINSHDKFLQQYEAEKHQMKLIKDKQEKTLEQQVKDAFLIAKQQVSAPKVINSAQKSAVNVSAQSSGVGQSPLNLVMSRNIPVGQTGIKMAAKQTGNSGHFHQEVVQRKNLTDNLIRQHLNDSSQGSPSLSSAKAVSKPISNPSNTRYMHLSSNSEVLRKSSPQSQTVKVSQTTQGKTTTPHVVTLHSSQNPVLFKSSVSPGSGPIRPATSLLKSLFNQAQEGGQNYPGISSHEPGLSSHHTGPSPSQRSPNQGVSNSNKGQGQLKHQWSPSSSSMTVQELQARLQSAAGMTPKSHIMGVASSQPRPGFQSVKLSSLTPEQLASYRAQQLKNNNGSGSILSKQMSPQDNNK